MRTFLGRITSPVKSLAAGLWQKQRKKELYELRMGSMELPAPGVSKLIGVSRTLLEAVPGAARQNHRQGWTILPLVNWVLSLGTCIWAQTRCSPKGGKPEGTWLATVCFPRIKKVLERDLRGA